MIALTPHLYIGAEQDCPQQALQTTPDDFAIVHACKEPCHRRLLGYTGRGAPKEHPEYLVAQRDRDLYANLVDAPNPDYFQQGVIERVLLFIAEQIADGKKVLVHCNRGESRAPGLALLYLHKSKYDTLPFQMNVAVNWLEQRVPTLNLSQGVRGMLEREW